MGKLVGAGFLLFLSLFMLLGFVRSDQAFTLPVTIMTLMVAVGAPAAGAAALLYLHRRERSLLALANTAERRRELRGDVLQAARRAGGKVTVIELAADLRAEPADVEHVLEELVAKGVADVRVTDVGQLVYAFPDIERLPEKGSAKDVLDA